MEEKKKTETEKQSEAWQMIVDLYGCPSVYIDDEEYVKKVIETVCSHIGAQIVKEYSYRFSPIGISAFAIITTSHISVHTWPEYGYAAVDLFSCKKEIPEGIRECLEQAFGAGRSRAQVIRRGLQRPVFPDFPLQEMQRTGGCPEPGRTPGCGQEGENTERKEEIHG